MYAVKCKQCGQFSGTDIKDFKKKIHTCVYCRKRLKLKKENELGLSTIMKGPFSVAALPNEVMLLNDRSGLHKKHQDG